MAGRSVGLARTPVTDPTHPPPPPALLASLGPPKEEARGTGTVGSQGPVKLFFLSQRLQGPKMSRDSG